MKSQREFLCLLMVVAGCASACSDGSAGSAPTGLTYSADTAVYTRDVPITPNLPTLAGADSARYHVAPALPPGLELGLTTGAITGTPDTIVEPADYVVTAANAAGNVHATLTLSVGEPPPAQALPNLGLQITPLSPAGGRFEPLNPNLADMPAWLAGQAVTTVVSPDHNTLLVLTSGFNRVFRTDGTLQNGSNVNGPDSLEYVFVYDISRHVPVKKQVIRVPNTYNGITFDPSGSAFYVSGGSGGALFAKLGDNVHVYALANDGITWAEDPAQTTALSLNHASGNGLRVAPAPGQATAVNLMVAVQPCSAGVALSRDGQTLVVANYYNDSISVFKGGLGHWAFAGERDLRPGSTDAAQHGKAGGSYPFWVAIKGNGVSAQAYVSSIRDREIVVVGLDSALAVTTRIAVKGQPGKMVLNATGSLLYVVEDQSDTVDVIDTTRAVILETIPVIAPASVLPSPVARLTGANPNSVALSADESELYVTNGNFNAVAVVALGGKQQGDRVVGLIPTGWYPNSVSFSGDGSWVYVVNGKSPTGANPGLCYSSAPAHDPAHLPDAPGTHRNCLASNQYNPQLIKAGFQSYPRPNSVQLRTMTEQVAANNHFSSVESAHDAAVMAAVRQGVKHVIFIIKENRSYDQVLGDLEIGNGDPDLAEFGEPLTPNQHALARGFVTLDNFFDSAEASNAGWPWTTSARSPDVIERQFPVTYAHRGLSLDSEGLNRNVNVAIPGSAGRVQADGLTPDDPDLLAGTTNVSAPDGPDNEVNTGYLWDNALRAHLSVRNYGFFVDTTLYPKTWPDPLPAGVTPIPLLEDPSATQTVVAHPANVALTPYTDPYFRGFDNQFPDYFRFKEWEREFDTTYAVAGGTPLPALSLVRFMHDHTGSFGDAIRGLDTPELQQADNDYAVGLLVQKIARSIYANDTLIFIIEDDSQDAGDHVDSHRSVLFVIGAYVKQGALVSTQYNTINVVRTIEEVLGLPPMNLNDALARPMTDIFASSPSAWTFVAKPSTYLYGSGLLPLLPPLAANAVVPRSTHSGRYWANVTKGMNFNSEDRMDFAAYNRVLWKGLEARPYPSRRSGKDLRKNRAELLARYRRP